MGNNKKIRRIKRMKVETIIDNSEVAKIKIDFNVEKGKYDECNQLILPSKKRPTKKRQEVVKSTRILSKNQRKKLEKIVEKKKKKTNRASLLEALAQVQAPFEELNYLTSLADLQTKGRKRYFVENKGEDGINDLFPNNKNSEINSLKGSKKRKKLLESSLIKNEISEEKDPNIVGFNNESYNSEDSEENFDVEILNRNEKEIKLDNNVCSTEAQNNSIPCEPISTKQSEKDILKEKEIKTEQVSCPAIFIPVDRDPNIQAERLKLPITAEEQVIMEAINENDVIIIAGETGSGKTTQVPQFLYEAGFGSKGKIIGITQPRRVAAIAMSKRVAQEMNLGTDVVSYLIRFEGNVTESTKIKFMTDGVLMKEIQSDFILSKYSVIILDEAHERNVYTDILIGLLSRIVPLRKKRGDTLKLIIMSATLKVSDFTENVNLFKTPPPVIQVNTRQFPVTIYFSKRTSENYLKDCFRKVIKIHSSLPEGGILVFVTGQNEVNYLVRKLRRTFPIKLEAGKAVVDCEMKLKKALKNAKNLKKKNNLLSNIEINLDKYSVVPNDDTELDFLEEIDDFDAINDDLDECVTINNGFSEPLWVLPMYSLLPSAEQAKVFEQAPSGYRLCVVSTNVAETSLTVPNIKYVVDSGKTKTKLYDKTTGVSKFQITWCSKASANQRAGRAGRICPGYCYRLFSSAVFNDEFNEFSIPEIQQKPIDDLILQMKAMNIIKVINFPFPTPPDILQLKSGEIRLRILGALEEPKNKKEEWTSKLTKLGETMSNFPVSPRFAKMIALSCQYNLLQYTVCIVAALSVNEVFLNHQETSISSQVYRNWAGSGNSFLLGDIMVLLRAVGAAEYSRHCLEEFCQQNGLRHKAICEIRKLRVQLTNQLNLNVPGLNLIVDPNMKPPTDTEAKLLRQIMLAGLTDHVAQKVNADEIKEEDKRRKWKKAYKSSEMEDPIFIHTSSVLKTEMPNWVVWQEVYETNKLYMRGVTAIEPEWLPIFAPYLCNLSEPLMEPSPKYKPSTGKVHGYVNGTFGRAALVLPTIEIPLADSLFSYKWFAKYFLEGEVFSKLKIYVESLLSAPSVMTKPWARLQPRTQLLLSTLVRKQVNSRDKVLNIWKSEPLYLLEAYKAWLPESAHLSVTNIWPPIS